VICALSETAAITQEVHVGLFEYVCVSTFDEWIVKLALSS